MLCFSEKIKSNVKSSTLTRLRVPVSNENDEFKKKINFGIPFILFSFYYPSKGKKIVKHSKMIIFIEKSESIRWKNRNKNV